MKVGAHGGVLLNEERQMMTKKRLTRQRGWLIAGEINVVASYGKPSGSIEISTIGVNVRQTEEKTMSGNVVSLAKLADRRKIQCILSSYHLKKWPIM